MTEFSGFYYIRNAGVRCSSHLSGTILIITFQPLTISEPSEKLYSFFYTTFMSAYVADFGRMMPKIEQGKINVIVGLPDMRSDKGWG